jgi:hypothetical protein
MQAVTSVVVASYSALFLVPLAFAIARKNRVSVLKHASCSISLSHCIRCYSFPFYTGLSVTLSCLPAVVLFPSLPNTPLLLILCSELDPQLHLGYPFLRIAAPL